MTYQDPKNVASQIISNFNMDPIFYKPYTAFKNSNISVKGINNNSVLFKGEPTGTINITFNKNVTNTFVYIGNNLKGNINIKFHQGGGFVYIGDDVSLKGLNILLRTPETSIIIGNNVSTTGSNSWGSGAGIDGHGPSIIVGDDCMFANGVDIRATDGHPIIDRETLTILNKPKDHIIIEPHVWIGKAVTILKSLKIGACSIISANACVTKSIPRFSVAAGLPARAKSAEGKMWSLSTAPRHVEQAKYFYDKYATYEELKE